MQNPRNRSEMRRESALVGHGTRRLAWAVLAVFLLTSIPLAWSRGGLPALVTLSAVDAVPSVGTTVGANGAAVAPPARQVAAPSPAVPQIAPTTRTVVPAPVLAQAPVVASAAKAVAPAPVATYNKKPLRVARTITMEVTAYCAGSCCCGKFADGITASGRTVRTNGGNLVAADTRVLPFNTVLSIPGYNSGRPVPVLDRGGAIKGNRLDLLMPTHEAAKKWGRKKLKVTVYEYVD